MRKMSLLDGLAQFEEIDSRKKLTAWLTGQLHQLNCSHFLLANLSNPAAGHITNFPAEWMQRFSEKNYVQVDAPARHCIVSQKPIAWRDAIRVAGTQPIAKRIVDEAASFGLTNGLSIPVLMPQRRGVLSVCFDGSEHEFLRFVNESMFALVGIAHMAYARFEVLALLGGQSAPTLSPRQRECLEFMSRGYTNKEIGSYMGLSHYTVADVVADILTELEASNRTEASTFGIRLGVI